MDDKKILLCLVGLALACFILGISLSNAITRAYLEPDIAESMAHCESQGRKECHAEWVYRGMVLVDYDVVGRE